MQVTPRASNMPTLQHLLDRGRLSSSKFQVDEKMKKKVPYTVKESGIQQASTWHACLHSLYGFTTKPCLAEDPQKINYTPYLLLVGICLQTTNLLYACSHCYWTAKLGWHDFTGSLVRSVAKPKLVSIALGRLWSIKNPSHKEAPAVVELKEVVTHDPHKYLGGHCGFLFFLSLKDTSNSYISTLYECPQPANLYPAKKKKKLGPIW